MPKAKVKTTIYRNETGNITICYPIFYIRANTFMVDFFGGPIAVPMVGLLHDHQLFVVQFDTFLVF
jgi:hypothetical protein